MSPEATNSQAELSNQMVPVPPLMQPMPQAAPANQVPANPAPPALPTIPMLPANPALTAIPAPQSEGLTASDRNSIVMTLLIGVGLAVLATISTQQVAHTPTSSWVLWLAVAVGGLGGLAHEVAQSGGKILFFERRLDGFYIGSLGGVILGAVAGLLAARGFVVNPSTVATAAQPGPIPLIFEIFFAGLALKGITEAAGGQTVSPGLKAIPSSASSPANNGSPVLQQAGQK